ncbi:MAG: VWA domain-containing protein, partial [Gammaproteobacteria bacterium]|nr:VWA domain-containing protein [Gammaproteobacteria bacterium]
MNAIFYLQDIYWREPLWLLLSFQPIIILILKKYIQKNNISLYVENKLQPWVIFPARYTLSKQVFSKNTAYLLAWLLFSIALAGPRTPLSQADKEQFYGANIMMVVDLSRSMKAMDIKPNRLRRAKTEIYEFLEKAKDHRIGITVFSARPHLFVPLTSDHEVLQTYIESLDKLSFPTMGSNPVNAILFAQNELKNIKGKSAIILLTDGDFSEITNKQIKQLKKENIPLYILGIGTPEGEAVPLKDGTWLKNEQQYVVSKMNVDVLEYLAAQLNGRYSPLYDDNSDWEILYDQGIARHNTAINIDGEQQILWDEAFSWFLIPSIFLFLFSLNSYRIQISKNTVIFPLTCIMLFSLTEKEVSALETGQTDEQFAYRTYMKGDYTTAEKYYKNIANHRTYHSHLGQANSLYKMGHYQKAIQQFTFAVVNAKSDTQRANALYNLAN